MPNGMTGFAEAEGLCGNMRIHWQPRSVNTRVLDISCHRTGTLHLETTLTQHAGARPLRGMDRGWPMPKLRDAS